MPKVCQDMHKCHNYHAILHKLYMHVVWQKRTQAILKQSKNFSIGGWRPPRPPLNTPMVRPHFCLLSGVGLDVASPFLLPAGRVGMGRFLCFRQVSSIVQKRQNAITVFAVNKRSYYRNHSIFRRLWTRFYRRTSRRRRH